jgi:phosphoribosylglycinamide formyltransferase 1
MLSTTAPRRHAATPYEPLRVVLLTTRGAPGLEDLLADPHRGLTWQLVAAVVTDPESPEVPRLGAARVPMLVRDLKAFTRARGARFDDLHVRREFDAETVGKLAPFAPDLLVLCAYLHIATRPLLEAYPARMVNVHDADLAIRGPDGRPRYRGLRSTRDAVAAGEPETRSTVHVVTAEVDVGPALVRSWGFPVHRLLLDARRWGAADIVKAYAYAQREWMMRAAWGPLVLETIGLYAKDELRWLDGRPVVAGRLGPMTLDAPRLRGPLDLHIAVGDGSR